VRRSAKDFQARLAAIEAAAPERRRRAERWIRSYYRTHRKLPRGAFACIASRQRLYTLICVAELEHLLGVAPIVARVIKLRKRASAYLAYLRG
jgi:hypothetical protein